MEISGPLTLIGCGKMGGAMLSGWLEHGLSPARVRLVEPNAAAISGFVEQGCRHVETSPADARVIVIAVKPQMMTGALGGLGSHVSEETLFVSIAAGVTLESFRQTLGPKARIVRTMPNTPASVRRSMTVMVAGPDVGAEDRTLAESLLSAVGETAWVDDEALLDPVTALSGGGPAYVFLLAEVLAKAGIAAGLPEALSQRLARATVAGSGELLNQAEQSPAILRQNVTSPGGTTLEALKVLMADEGLQPLMNRAIAAATARSRELGG